jgi:phage terminase small subunit
MARPRKSPDERRLDGNPSRRPIPFDVFTPEGAPFVPEHLHDDAQACMEHVIRTFRTKRLSSADSYGLAAFAMAWAWHKAASHAMNAPDFEPVVDGSRGGKVPNPWFKILTAMSAEMRSWATKLYLTPADRASLVLVGEEKPKSKFDGLRGQTSLSNTLNS